MVELSGTGGEFSDVFEDYARRGFAMSGWRPLIKEVPATAVDLNAKLSNSALELCVAEQQLAGPQIADFWRGHLSSGAISRDQLLINFAESEENVALTAPNMDVGFWVI